jgi:hypothetical protein
MSSVGTSILTVCHEEISVNVTGVELPLTSIALKYVTVYGVAILLVAANS